MVACEGGTRRVKEGSIFWFSWLEIILTFSQLFRRLGALAWLKKKLWWDMIKEESACDRSLTDYKFVSKILLSWCTQSLLSWFWLLCENIKEVNRKWLHRLLETTACVLFWSFTRVPCSLRSYYMFEFDADSLLKTQIFWWFPCEWNIIQHPAHGHSLDRLACAVFRELKWNPNFWILFHKWESFQLTFVTTLITTHTVQLWKKCFASIVNELAFT